MVGDVLAVALAGVNPFLVVLVFSLAASCLATFTGSNLGTAMVFAPIAVAACMALGYNPTAAAAAPVRRAGSGRRSSSSLCILPMVKSDNRRKTICWYLYCSL